MQTDSRNHKVNGGAALAIYLAIFWQKSNCKEIPEKETKLRTRVIILYYGLTIG
jgi:hypothetical protein